MYCLINFRDSVLFLLLQSAMIRTLQMSPGVPQVRKSMQICWMLLRPDGRRSKNSKSYKPNCTDKSCQFEHAQSPCATNRTHAHLMKSGSPYRYSCRYISSPEGG